MLRIVSRDTVPYVVVIWVLTFAARIPYRLVCRVCVVSAVLASMLALIENPVVLMGSQRLAAFTGGNVVVDDSAGSDQLGLHSSAYFVLLSLFLVDSFRRNGTLPKTAAYVVLGFLFLLLIKYDVRTTYTMLAAYVIGHVLRSRWGRPLRQAAVFVAALALISCAGALITTNVFDDAASWGSGRLGNYEFRINMLAQRDLLPLLFGTGPSSDAFVTPMWWWDAKDSHSDLFHELVETGIVGLAGLCAFFLALWKRLASISRPLFLSLLCCSAISNGLLQRPTEFFLLALAMAAAERGVVGNRNPALGWARGRA
jgi:hypothetical protein